MLVYSQRVHSWQKLNNQCSLTNAIFWQKLSWWFWWLLLIHVNVRFQSTEKLTRQWFKALSISRGEVKSHEKLTNHWRMQEETKKRVSPRYAHTQGTNQCRLLSNDKRVCTGKSGIDYETKTYDQVPAHFPALSARCSIWEMLAFMTRSEDTIDID